MLKIAEYRNVLGEDRKSIRRERIDLKELEKFGFNECSDYFYHYEPTLQADICVNKRSRTISKFDFHTSIHRNRRDRKTSTLKEIQIVQDLIQANLVEE